MINDASRYDRQSLQSLQAACGLRTEMVRMRVTEVGRLASSQTVGSLHSKNFARPVSIEDSIMRYTLNLLALCVFLILSTSASADEGHVNVIIIYADDLGYGDLSCYGHEAFETPRLDQLATEGARFTQFYTTCGFCAPSRASLLTGRYPHRNNLMTSNPVPARDYGVAGNPNHPGDTLGLPVEELTLGEMFHAAGHHTCCIGKWHLGHQPEFYPTRAGFDEYLGILYSNDMHPVELWRNEEVVEYPVVQATITRRYTDRAIEFIEEHQAEPFFLYLPHAMPHKPLAASEEFYQSTGHGLYADVISELDAEIGRLVDAVDRLELASKTLIVFTSDNGPWYGGSTGGLRGMKGTWWEGGIRVPMIARWPGVIEAGQTIDEPAIILDLFTTALAVAGIELPDDRAIDGVNLMPLLRGSSSLNERPLFSFQGQIRTVRVGDWKLHTSIPGPQNRNDDWIDPRRPNGVTLLAPYEQARPSEYPGLLTGDEPTGVALFNLADDPGEQRNLADENPIKVLLMLDLIEQMQSQAGLPIGEGS